MICGWLAANLEDSSEGETLNNFIPENRLKENSMQGLISNKFYFMEFIIIFDSFGLS
jgi:hypothetical protein